MTSSAEVYVLMKSAELAKRCGLKAEDAEGFLSYIDEEKDPDGVGYYMLSFTSPDYSLGEQSGKFFGLLGIDRATMSIKGQLSDFEDMVDRALSLAPRARSV